MKKKTFFSLCKEIAIVLFILFIADRVTGHILRYFYFRQVSGGNYRTTLTIDSIRTEALVFGSSHASHHYVPEIIEEKLKLSFYNCGRDGNFILYNYAAFKAVIGRYNPKIILFDLDPNQLIYNNLEYERLSNLLPYYKEHYELRNIIELRGPYEKYKLYSSIYPFNSMLLYLAFFNLELSRTRYDESHKGYLPLYNKMNAVKANNFLKEPIGKIDENKINAINDIVTSCKRNNIRLIFVNSPIFSNSTETKGTKILENIFKSERCQYLDFSNDSIFDNHPEYFHDNEHLNDEGAKKFSVLLCEKILN